MNPQQQFFDDLEQRIAEKEAIRENSARLASAYSAYKSTGQGSVQFARRTDFELTFIERPFVAYGAVIDLDDLADLLNLDPGDDIPIPLVSGFVTEWDVDERGFYIGAWVACRVQFPTGTPAVPPDTAVKVEHHFTFQAIAMKDIPLDVRD